MRVGVEKTESHTLGVLAASVAVSVWGMSSIIAKGIDMGGLAIVAYRFTLYALVAGVVMTIRGKPPTIRVLRESLWGGLALGFDGALFFSAVKATSVANATVIGALQPVVVAAVSWKFFGERLARRDIGLALVAIVGVAVVVLGGGEGGARTMFGDILSVGAVFAWAAYFIASKRAQAKISSTEFTFGAALWCGLINIVAAPVFGQNLSWPSPNSWIGIILLAFGSGILGHSLMNWSIQQIPLWISSTLTLLIPVVATFGAWLFLDENLATVQILAMCVVLAALAGIVGHQSGIGAKPRPLRR